MMTMTLIARAVENDQRNLFAIVSVENVEGENVETIVGEVIMPSSVLEPEAALSAWIDGLTESTPPPTAADVIAERVRRLSLGFDYDFADARGVHRIGTTPADMAGWDEVAKLASALIATGNGTTNIQIVSDTGPVEVTAAEWQLVLLAAAAFRQPIWAASFMLQAADPIPPDYDDDARWPAVPA